MVSGTLNDAWVRTEHYLRESKTEFYQVGAHLGPGAQRQVPLHAARRHLQVRRRHPGRDDDRLRRPRRAGLSVTTTPTCASPAADLRHQRRPIRRTSSWPKSATGRRTSPTSSAPRSCATEWDVIDDFTAQGRRRLPPLQFRHRSASPATPWSAATAGSTACSARITCSPTRAVRPDRGLRLPGHRRARRDCSRSATPASRPAPPTSWLIPNLDAAAAFTGLYNRTPAVDAGNTRGVVEEVTGGYLQFDVKGELFGIELRRSTRACATSTPTRPRPASTAARRSRSSATMTTGCRRSTSRSSRPTTSSSAPRSSKVITRPTLGNLTPGGSVDGFNYRVTFGNPFLDPFRATAYDLALEWYFAPQSIVSVALFQQGHRELPGRANTRSGTFASTGLPISVIPPSSPGGDQPAKASCGRSTRSSTAPAPT